METLNSWTIIALVLRDVDTGKFVVEAYHTYRFKPWMADQKECEAMFLLAKESPEVAEAEDAIRILRMMELRSRFGGPYLGGGLLSFHSHTKLNVEEFESVLNSMSEARITEVTTQARKVTA